MGTPSGPSLFKTVWRMVRGVRGVASPLHRRPHGPLMPEEGGSCGRHIKAAPSFPGAAPPSPGEDATVVGTRARKTHRSFTPGAAIGGTASGAIGATCSDPLVSASTWDEEPEGGKCQAESSRTGDYVERGTWRSRIRRAHFKREMEVSR